MNTSRTVIRASLGLLASGLFAAAALAGPGAQYWSRSAPKLNPKAQTATTEGPAAGKCSDCKTTRVWSVSDRGIAGKGVPGTKVTGKRHECARCTGSIVSNQGKLRNSMVHDAACAPALCCK